MNVRVEACFATANIQNYPDMSPAHVNQDHWHVMRKADVILWQETGERADYDSIVRVGKQFPEKAFTTTAYRNECPISWNTNLFHHVGEAESIKMSHGLGPGSKSPARYLTRLVLRSVKYPNMPLIEIHNVHYIQNAWNSKAVTDKVARRHQWHTEWKMHRDLALAALRERRIVIFGGDWNRNSADIPKFTDRQKWVIGRHAGLDHVGAIAPSFARVEARAPFSLDLNSDHRARGAQLIISGPNRN